MIRFLTAGESHGPVLTAVVEGIPAGVPLETKSVNDMLAERQMGFGRGGRMAIEHDEIQLVSGVRHGVTIGSPITMLIGNRDWVHWKDRPPERTAITRPRPGHADLAGALKYGHRDIRNVLERASARETAARVAAGAVAKSFLRLFGIQVVGYVVEVGGIRIPGAVTGGPDHLRARILRSQLRCPHPIAERRMIRAIQHAIEARDTVGGVIEVKAWGVPAGLGSYAQWDRRLDGKLAQALMSIQAMKGVEIGAAWSTSKVSGSLAHDEIFFSAQKGYFRRSNRAGGIEGGVSNGEVVWARVAMKPLSTLRRPLRSVDMTTKQSARAAYERSDVCAVPAGAVVAEAMMAWVLADVWCEKFGGDSLDEMRRNVRGYLRVIRAR